ncbi:hypothetical protein [Dysgonomonas sp. ZJ279]|uniref:hypothetical protein n=1 Tax=Dysgonomonas sp. ZJ279 TaxID=2709796 RepID=UPI0013EBDB9E|nr:hypothetical protein [Dysgonomonas sp. ZJ279]
MKKVLFSLVVAVAAFTSCSNGPSAIEFNDAIVNANAKIAQQQIEYDSKLTNAIESDSYSALKVENDSALARVDREIAIIKEMGTAKGGEAFKESALTTFDAVRKLIEVGGKFSTLTENSTEEDFNKLIEEYNAQMNDYSTKVDAMGGIQAAFAKDQNYDLR